MGRGTLIQFSQIEISIVQKFSDSLKWSHNGALQIEKLDRDSKFSLSIMCIWIDTSVEPIRVEHKLGIGNSSGNKKVLWLLRSLKGTRGRSNEIVKLAWASSYSLEQDNYNVADYAEFWRKKREKWDFQWQICII